MNLDLIEAIRTVQNAIDTDLNHDYFQELSNRLFPGCSSGSEAEADSTVIAANINLVLEDGTLYDLCWTRGSRDVRITRFTGD